MDIGGDSLHQSERASPDPALAVPCCESGSTAQMSQRNWEISMESSGVARETSVGHAVLESSPTSCRQSGTNKGTQLREAAEEDQKSTLRPEVFTLKPDCGQTNTVSSIRVPVDQSVRPAQGLDQRGVRL
jgi:hypothetical protein